MLSIGLYLVIDACWIPVTLLEMRMHRPAEAALTAGTALPDRYHCYARCWFCPGWPAFAVVAIFYLVVFQSL